MEDKERLQNLAETVQTDGGSETELSVPRGLAFPIVGVGASAGGLDAFTRLLKALPEKTGMAFVLIQHLDPNHDSQLTEILSTATAMPVRTVQDAMAVKPDEVYVIPPNKTMVLEDGHLKLLQRNPGLHLPVDAFFESLARAQGGRAIAIVLSGNASDGSHGVRAVKQECGLTFAQDEGSAQHFGMPGNAIATGAVDYVLPPQEIANELMHLGHHPFFRAAEASRAQHELLPDGDGDLKKIFTLLRNSTKVDFTHYKQNTIRRRIGRRMIVKRAPTLREYARLLTDSPEEVRELFRDLLISVTNFFRNPNTFEELCRLVRDLLAARNGSEPFRVWVPGCATGEEIYSIAICLKELAEELHINSPMQLFGTDISDSALERARLGVYPDAIGQNVSAERLRRFFVRMGQGYQVSKTIRECCIFARQDVTSDPPFGRIDLISCRNLLIYLDSSLQRKVLPLFHYSLKPDGLLLLGSAESIGSASELFIVVDRQHRIYGRKAVPLRLTLPLTASNGVTERQEPGRARTTSNGMDLQRKADLILQSKYAPAAVVVDSDLQILHFRGHTGFYLEPPPGEATLNLLRMARENLALPLRRTIQAAARQNYSVREPGIAVEHRGERRVVNLEVTPIAGSAAGERYFLVVFEEQAVRVEAGEASTVSALVPEVDVDTRLKDLQQQVGELRESLRNAREDHEASSEELRAANEEVSSANEELQSSNEELSTTKEELQGANEELSTLNEELQNRNVDLDAINNDLVNLLSAVDIPFLMVDNELRLRRFSASAEKVFNVKATDIGHPVALLDGDISLSGFHRKLRQVIETLMVEQWDLQDSAGKWFSATVRPYRTTDNRIAGAVMVFVDIDPIKKILRATEEARDYAEGMIETVREPLLVLDGDLRIQRATPAFYEVFRVSRSETENRLLYDIGNGQWNVPRLREALGHALFRDEAFQDLEIEHLFPHIGRRTMRLNARRISRENDTARRVLLAIEDVTERRETAEIRYQRLFETAKDAMLIFDAETERLTDVNPYFLELTGYQRENLMGSRLGEMEAFQGAREEATGAVTAAIAHEVVRCDGVPIRARNGNRLEIELVANRYLVGGQQVVQVNVRDVTKRNEAQKALRESEERFRLFVESVRDYALFQMDLNARITSWNSGAERLLGFSESEILGQPAARLFTPEDRASGEAEREVEKARSTGRAEDERWHMRKDGSRFFASGVLTTVRDEGGRLRGFAKIMRDITERKEAEEQVRTSLREKEVLLKEIHHRVKNNLQVITSLLSLQSEHLGDSKVAGVLDDMKTRVRSIATIHEMLYGSENLARIDFADYLKAIGNDLISFYLADSDRVRLNVSAEQVFLNITQAVPCGLIVNELLTNSFKYAFPGGRKGTIEVSFRREGSHCTLEIADDGIGLPAELDLQNQASMGLHLVSLLVQQLKATVVVGRSKGTRFALSFVQKA